MPGTVRYLVGFRGAWPYSNIFQILTSVVFPTLVLFPNNVPITFQILFWLHLQIIFTCVSNLCESGTDFVEKAWGRRGPGLEYLEFGEASRNIQYFSIFSIAFPISAILARIWKDRPRRGGRGRDLKIWNLEKEIFNIFSIFSIAFPFSAILARMCQRENGAGISKSGIWRGLEEYSLIFPEYCQLHFQFLLFGADLQGQAKEFLRVWAGIGAERPG